MPLRGGGENPSMSYYANYMLFDSPAPLDAPTGTHQVFMRRLGAAASWLLSAGVGSTVQT